MSRPVTQYKELVQLLFQLDRAEKALFANDAAQARTILAEMRATLEEALRRLKAEA